MLCVETPLHFERARDIVLSLHLRSRKAMAHISFTSNIQRHVECPPVDAPGRTVREALDVVFAANPRARSYVLDDQGALRKHMVIFIDESTIRDRQTLSDAIDEDTELYVMQALSGG